MKITMRTFVCFAALAFGTSLVQAQDAGTGAVKYRPDEIKYTKTPAGLETAVLLGNPTQAGLFVTRIKFPAGFKVPPHWHPDVSQTVVVLSGTLYFGLGERWDETKLEARPARKLLLRGAEGATLRLGKGWRSDPSGDGHWAIRHDQHRAAQVAAAQYRPSI